MTQCKLFVSTLLSVIVFCPTFAWAQFDNLTSRIPDGANMMILVDVDRLLDSPLAATKGWHEQHENAFQA